MERNRKFLEQLGIDHVPMAPNNVPRRSAAMKRRKPAHGSAGGVENAPPPRPTRRSRRLRSKKDSSGDAPSHVSPERSSESETSEDDLPFDDSLVATYVATAQDTESPTVSAAANVAKASFESGGRIARLRETFGPFADER